MNDSTAFFYFDISQKGSIQCGVNITIKIMILLILLLLFIRIFFNNAKWIKQLRKKLRGKEVSFDLKIFKISGKLFSYSETNTAAWKMYVELASRVSGIELGENNGILRESLTSLYECFKISRQIIVQAGPELGEHTDKVAKSVADLMLEILNQKIRPVLEEWHPKLQKYEAKKPADISQAEHEANWNEAKVLRNELVLLKSGLEEYILLLKNIALH